MPVGAEWRRSIDKESGKWSNGTRSWKTMRRFCILLGICMSIAITLMGCYTYTYYPYDPYDYYYTPDSEYSYYKYYDYPYPYYYSPYRFYFYYDYNYPYRQYYFPYRPH
jgi:hypothetical protein